MTDDARDRWRKALAARAKAARTQRGKHRKPTIRPGMIRKRPTQDVPASGGAAQEGTT